MAKNWTKDEALRVLKELADETDKLRAFRPFSTEHTKWLLKCSSILEEIFGTNSRYFGSLVSISWQVPPGIIDTWEYGGNVQAAIDAKHQESYLRLLGSAKGMLNAASEYLNERDLTTVYVSKITGPEANQLIRIQFLVENQLRKAIKEKPTTEKQIQDYFESLLIGATIEFSRETDKIEYSSKTYIPDFSFHKINLAVEIKLCGKEGREKEIIAEINDDILGYKTKYSNLLFIVYDMGFIRDKDKFIGSFERHNDVLVKVIKH